MPNDSKKYLISFVITASIFATAIFLSDFFTQKRIEDIRTLSETIATDILSLETQFDLLQELACTDITENSILSHEIGRLANRLSFMENDLGTNNAEVVRLKRQYSLLQIKDLLLVKKVSEKCNFEPATIVYFYSNKGDCTACTREGYVLTELSRKYPKLRVYSFDYDLDLSALKTLIAIQNVPRSLPALIINEKTYTGFHNAEAIETLLPMLALQATSTKQQ